MQIGLLKEFFVIFGLLKSNSAMKTAYTLRSSIYIYIYTNTHSFSLLLEPFRVCGLRPGHLHYLPRVCATPGSSTHKYST